MNLGMALRENHGVHCGRCGCLDLRRFQAAPHGASPPLCSRYGVIGGPKEVCSGQKTRRDTLFMWKNLPRRWLLGFLVELGGGLLTLGMWGGMWFGTGKYPMSMDSVSEVRSAGQKES